MQQKEFSIIVNGICSLTPSQIELLLCRLTVARQKTEALSEIEACSQDCHCPHCFGTKRQKWGKTKADVQRYRCTTCSKTYTGRTGSVLSKIHRPDLFLLALKDMLESPTPLSVRMLAAKLGLNKHTVWRWRMLILQNLPIPLSPAMTGILEADETYQRESRKGSREWVRHFAAPDQFEAPPHPRWKDFTTMGLKKMRGLSRWQKAILTVTDRAGERHFQRLEGRKPATIENHLLPLIPQDAILCSDKAPAYSNLASKLGIQHFAVGSGAGEREKFGCYHIQNVNSLHSKSKRFIRLFRGPATKYLDG